MANTIVQSKPNALPWIGGAVVFVVIAVFVVLAIIRGGKKSAPQKLQDGTMFYAGPYSDDIRGELAKEYASSDPTVFERLNLLDDKRFALVAKDFERKSPEKTLRQTLITYKTTLWTYTTSGAATYDAVTKTIAKLQKLNLQ
jgi:hypothetical protein